jgi:hypothetical protein
MSDQTPHDPSSTPPSNDAWTQPNSDPSRPTPHHGASAEQPPAYGQPATHGQPPAYGEQQPSQGRFPAYGEQSSGPGSYGQNLSAQQQYGQQRLGQNPNAQQQSGQNPYAQQQSGQNPYGQNPYGQPGAGPYPGSRSALAIVSMILGIVGAVFGFAFTFGLMPIAAVVTGFIARSRIRRYQQQGSGMALAGIITGFVGIAFTVGFIALYAVFIVNAFNSGDLSGTGTGTSNP